MAEKEVLMSLEGLKKMEDELELLKSIRRKEVAERIKQAIEFGDISENSEYEDAKNEQAFIEGSIIDLEKKLRNAKIIDVSEVSLSSVSVGCRVRVLNMTNDLEMNFEIVGSVDAEPAKGRISNESPVGRGLVGHAVGEIVEIPIPAGSASFKILNISR